jgi:CBS domain-containing protein
MATVRMLHASKSRTTNYMIDADETVFRALEVMAKADIGALLVKKDEKIVGIFTERDYARKGELKGNAAKKTPVRDVMTEQMVTVNPDTTVDQCMAMMMKYRIRHLPVIENEKLVGVISMRDVFDVVLSDKDTLIKGMENLMLGSGFRT